MPLTEDRRTPRRNGDQFDYPVAASTKIFGGALVVLDSGNAKPGAVATGLVAVGVAEQVVDNTGGGAGDRRVQVRAGVFQFKNSGGGDAIGHIHIGSTCYIVDDQTVALTNGTNTRSAAGKIVDVDSSGVWVRVG